MPKKLLLVPALAGLIAGVALYLHHVQEAPPTPLSLTPDLVVQGGQVRLFQSGFFPAEPVDVRIGDREKGPATRELRQARASLQGTLDAVSVVLPDDVPSGAHALQIVGELSGRQTITVVWIRARAPWLTLGKGDLKPRAPFGVILGGFAPGETVRLSMKPALSPSSSTSPRLSAPLDVGELPTDRVGNSAYTTFKVPFRAPGDYVLVARGETSHQELQQKISLTPYQPTFDLSPWYGPPGLKVQLNARGYAPGERVRIYLGNAAQAAATVVADQYGNFWGAGNVPVPYTVTSGSVDVRAVGEESGATAVRQFSVQKPKPWLELSIYYGAPSAPVTFSGGGWAAGEHIAFHLDSARNAPVAYGQADAYGWLHDAGPVSIPKDAAPQVTFVAVGQESHSVATATFKVIYPFGLRPAPGGAAPVGPSL